MRRRVAVLLGVVVLAASGLALVVPSAASAADVCAGLGNGLTGPLYYPVTVDPTSTLVTVRQPQTVGFGFTFASGLATCFSSDGTLMKGLTAGGTLTGWCGHWSGQGMANDGANFAWLNVGGIVVFTGHIVGIAYVAPALPVLVSCLTGTTAWILTFAVALFHCALLTSSSVTVLVPSTLTTRIPGVLRTHTGPMDYHFSLCFPGPL